MRVVFMGTPAFAVPSLTALAREHEVALVVTRPDAVRSRGKRLEPSPVKEAALELGLPVLETARMTPEALEALRDAAADIFCVAAYGCILPDAVLTMAPLGCVNVHASLLPRWRGAAPIQRAILAGDEVAGVSIMRIGHGVDTGAYCAQASTPVGEKGADELTRDLAELGGALLARTLPAIAAGSAVWTEQDEALVTHAAKIAKDCTPELDMINYAGLQMPPLFIWHNRDDQFVPVTNPLMIASRMTELGLPYELHVFGGGRHGMSVANDLACHEGHMRTVCEESPSVAEWVPLATAWIDRLFGVKRLGRVL